MQYDIYEARIVKIANFIKFIFRHKIKIMLCFAFAFIITGTLLGTKGIIVKAQSCPEEIVYGDNLKWKAEAFLSDVKYEYREKNSDEWTEEHPVLVGDYYVRASAKALFGYRHSDEQAFTIKPKQITVKVGSMTYGELPTISASTAYNDTVSCNSFVYGEIDTEKMQITAQPEPKAIKVKSEDGNDVTNCYEIKLGEAKTVTVKPRPITVNVPDKTKVWDGTPLFSIADECTVTVGSFVPGDTPTYVFSKQLSDVGKLEYNVPAYTVINSDGKDVSALYDIYFGNPTLTVTKRPVKVVTAGATQVYDGTSLTKSDGFTATGLREGDVFEILKSSYLNAVGEIQNKIENYKITDINGETVTQFYELDASECGMLKVTLRPITVTTADAHKTYDGTALSTDKFEQTGLVLGHTFKIKTSTSITTVAESGALNDILDYDIVDKYGSSVKGNYTLAVNKGTLTIGVRTITVTTGDDFKIYDGKAFGKTNVYTALGLAEGQTFKVVSSTSIINVNESGAKNAITEWDVVITGTETSVKVNYDIILNNDGILTVTPRPITVYTSDAEKVYDATPLKNPSYDKVDGIVEGHRFVINDSASITNASETAPENNEVFDYDVFNGTVSVKDNYSVSYKKGTLTVKPKPITVITGSDSKIYDGTELTNADVDVDGIIKNDSIVHTYTGIYTVGSQTEVGESKNTYNRDNFAVVDGNGNDVTDNYTFGEHRLGSLVVTPRSITVYTSDAYKVYDAEPLTKPSYDKVEGLAPGHVFKITSASSITDVVESGKINEVLSFEINDADGNYVNPDNYIIGYDHGTLTVAKRPISITTSSYTGTYDGKDHSGDSNQGITVGGDGLAPGYHYLSVLSTTPMKNAVNNKDNVITFEIVNKVGESVDMNNYEFISEHCYGKINIDKFLLEINTGSNEFVYNGTAQVYENFEPVDAVKYNTIKDYISRTEYDNQSSVTNVWDAAENVFDLIIYDKEGELATDNYDVRIISKGTLTVKPRDIRFASEDKTFNYTADWQVWERAYISSGSLASNHTVEYKFTGKIKDVGTADNTFDAEILSNGVPVDERNYNVDIDFGTLTVLKRTISVTTASDKKEWDGTALTAPVWQISDSSENGLIVGHEIYIPDSYKAQFTGSQTDIGKSDNSYVLENGGVKYYPIIRDANTKEDVTGNYDVEYLFGTLEVIKRKITVYTSTASKVYDATPLTAPTYEKVEGLLDGHTFKVISSTSITDVNKETVLNEVLEYDIVDSKPQSFFGKYDVSYVRGTLTVTPLSVELSTSSAEKNYDGTPLTAPTWDVSVLVGGHTVKTPTPNGTRTEVGKTDNTYDTKQKIVIVDGERDVSDNYIVTPKLGVLEVKADIIYVTTASDSKTYNGTKLSNGKFEAKGLKEGHRFVVTKSSEITDVGEIDNVFIEYDVVDGKNVSVIGEYTDVDFTYGKLTVKAREISIATGSDKKSYDTKPLTSHTFVLGAESASLVKGHKFYVSEGIEGRFTGSQTSVGTSKNTYLLTETLGDGTVKYYFPSIVDEKGNDVTANYDFGNDIELGTLTVVASAFGLPENYDSQAAKNKIMFVVRSEEDGTIYLKTASYGNYVGTGFDLANEYTELYDADVSAAYILSLILDANGEMPSTVFINPQGGIYALPYYAFDVPQSSDVYVVGNASSSYSAEAFLSDYYSALSTNKYDIVTFEENYKKFVYENYSYVDDDTLEVMRAIIEAEGFDKNDSEIILKVADYIKFAANYSLEYDRALDKQDNIIVAFLTNPLYNKGICQHYAAAATMLYRALGIPARYTVGYAAQTKANTSVNVTEFNAHAWVEIYLDGMGWVKVEVTGSPKETITLKPIDVEKGFDQVVNKTLDSSAFAGSTDIFSELEGRLENDTVLAELLKEGYTYQVTFSGKQVGIGKSEYSIESFKLISPFGKDVTERYIIDKQKGSLEIKASGTIEIYIHQNISAYTGNPVSAEKFSYKTAIPDNMTVDIKLNISLTDIVKGKTENVIKASDINDSIGKYITYAVSVDGVPVDDLSAIEIKVVNWDTSTGDDYEVVKVTQREIHLEIVAKNSLKVGDTFDPDTHCQIIATMGDDVLKNFTIEVEIYDNVDTSTVGPKDIRINSESFRILDKDGNDVSHNFNYYTENGGIKILNVTIEKIAVTN